MCWVDVLQDRCDEYVAVAYVCVMCHVAQHGVCVYGYAEMYIDSRIAILSPTWASCHLLTSFRCDVVCGAFPERSAGGHAQGQQRKPARLTRLQRRGDSGNRVAGDEMQRRTEAHGTYVLRFFNTFSTRNHARVNLPKTYSLSHEGIVTTLREEEATKDKASLFLFLLLLPLPLLLLFFLFR